MSRSAARERAFQLLYQLEIQKTDPEEQIQSFLAQVTYAPKTASDEYPPEEYPAELGIPVAPDEKQYIETAVRYVIGHKVELDQCFSDFLVGWSIDRLPIVDLCIMRLATYEITRLPDIPFNVSVSEAVLLTKKYADDSSRPYINAVLGKLKQFACEKTKEEARD